MKDMKYYTAKEASEELEVGYSTVRKYCNTHNIGAKVGRDWVLTREDIERLKVAMKDYEMGSDCEVLPSSRYVKGSG